MINVFKSHTNGDQQLLSAAFSQVACVDAMKNKPCFEYHL